MSLPEPTLTGLTLPVVCERIADSLRTSAALLQTLYDGLVRRRTAWIAARPSALQEPAVAMGQVAQELAAESGRLRELFAAAKQRLPAALATSPNLHLDASLLARHLPPSAAARLDQARRLATDAARRVRVEHALGERLLRFSQHTHESLMSRVAETLSTTALDVGGYDRAARRIASAIGTGTAPGSLIDGRM